MPLRCCTVAAPVIPCWRVCLGSRIIGLGSTRSVEGIQPGSLMSAIGNCHRPGSRNWLVGAWTSSARFTSSSHIESRRSVRPHVGPPKAKPVNAPVWASTMERTDREPGGKSFPMRLRPAGGRDISLVVYLRARAELERRKLDRTSSRVYSIHTIGGDYLKSREVIKRLKADGWAKVRQEGSHIQFRHKTKPGTVTVPHPESDLAIGTLKSIERQSGLKLR